MKINALFLPALAAVLLGFLFSACATIPYSNDFFTMDEGSPKITAGSFEAQFDKVIALMGIKKDMINVEYYPLEDAVCLQYRIEFFTYNQFWNRRARAAFVKALADYKEDYSAKAFGKSNKQSKVKYGRVYSYLIWQMFQYTVKAKAANAIELGYYFRNDSPYFSINQKEAKYEDPVSRDNNRDSLDIMMYLTRAQADELAALFDQKFLDGLAAAKAGTYTTNPTAEYEEY